jgi:sulfatase maturation enzyme AslB (radical SAM superfamily)
MYALRVGQGGTGTAKLGFVMSIVGEDGKMSFRTINFEVAGMCNGRCNYCVTGAKNANPGGIMPANTSRRLLQAGSRGHIDCAAIRPGVPE